MAIAIVLIIAYLLGSLPTSYIVANRMTGRDIRDLGDGNPGMMNVWDSVGLLAALIVGVGDIGKGMAAVTIAILTDTHEIAPTLAGLVAILGHDYSVFLLLDGGNGMGPAVGAICALAPLAAAPAAVVSIAFWLFLGSRRLAGSIGLLLVPGLTYIASNDPSVVAGVVACLTLAALKIIRFEGFTPARSRIKQ